MMSLFHREPPSSPKPHDFAHTTRRLALCMSLSSQQYIKEATETH